MLNPNITSFFISVDSSKILNNMSKLKVCSQNLDYELKKVHIKDFK